MPLSNINHNSWFWVTARLVAVILVPRKGYSARRPPIGAQRINRTRKAFIGRLKPRRRKQEASRLAAPATTEIRIAMLDPRHVDATYHVRRLASSRSCSVAARRRYTSYLR
jgi:hypothetical protein